MGDVEILGELHATVPTGKGLVPFHVCGRLFCLRKFDKTLFSTSLAQPVASAFFPQSDTAVASITPLSAKWLNARV